MSGYRPGDRVLYRDGDRFFVGRVDLVKERHVTAFPFDTARGTWSRKNRRVPFSFVLGKLPTRADRIAYQINRLANQREAERQRANSQFQDSVRKLLAPESTSL